MVRAMSLAGDLTKLLSRSPVELGLLAEAAGWLVAAETLVHWTSFARIRRLFALRAGDGVMALTRRQVDTASRIGWAARVAAARLPVDTACLGQALAVLAMLRRRGIPGTLYLGVVKEASRPALEAHAWLKAGGAIVSGAAGHERYQVIDRLSW